MSIVARAFLLVLSVALPASSVIVGREARTDGPPPTFAVVPIALNDLSHQPENPAEAPTLVLLAQEIATRLVACGYGVSPIDSAPLAVSAWPRGYFYDHPDLAADWAARRHADWALVGRLNRVSPWVADLEMRVVSAADQRALTTRVVELKGLGMNPDLTARLANRGAAWMVDQVLQGLAQAVPDSTHPFRLCPA